MSSLESVLRLITGTKSKLKKNRWLVISKLVQP